MPVFNNSDTINNMQRNGILLTSDETPVPIDSDSYSYLTVNSSNVDAEIGDVVAYDDSIGKFKTHSNLINLSPAYEVSKQLTRYYPYKFGNKIFGIYCGTPNSITGFMIEDGKYTKKNTLTLSCSVAYAENLVSSTIMRSFDNSNMKYCFNPNNKNPNIIIFGASGFSGHTSYLYGFSQNTTTGEIAIIATRESNLDSSDIYDISFVDLTSSCDLTEGNYTLTASTTIKSGGSNYWSFPYQYDSWKERIDYILGLSPPGMRINIRADGVVYGTTTFTSRRFNYGGYNGLTNSSSINTTIDGKSVTITKFDENGILDSSIIPELGTRIISLSTYYAYNADAQWDDIYERYMNMCEFTVYDTKTGQYVEHRIFNNGGYIHQPGFGNIGGSTISCGVDNGILRFIAGCSNSPSSSNSLKPANFWFELYWFDLTIGNMTIESLESGYHSSIYNSNILKYVGYNPGYKGCFITQELRENLEIQDTKNLYYRFDSRRGGVSYEILDYSYYDISFSTLSKFPSTSVNGIVCLSPTGDSNILKFYSYDYTTNQIVIDNDIAIELASGVLNMEMIEDLLVVSAPGYISTFKLDLNNKTITPTVEFISNNTTPVGVYEKDYASIAYIKRVGLLDLSDSELISRNVAELKLSTDKLFKIVLSSQINADNSRFGVIIIDDMIYGIHITSSGVITKYSTGYSVNLEHRKFDIVIDNRRLSSGNSDVVLVYGKDDRLYLNIYTLNRYGVLIQKSTGNTYCNAHQLNNTYDDNSWLDLTITKIFTEYVTATNGTKDYVTYISTSSSGRRNGSAYEWLYAAISYLPRTYVVQTGGDFEKYPFSVVSWKPEYQSDPTIFIDINSSNIKKGLESSNTTSTYPNYYITGGNGTSSDLYTNSGIRTYFSSNNQISPSSISYIEDVGVIRNRSLEYGFDVTSDGKLIYVIDSEGREVIGYIVTTSGNNTFTNIKILGDGISNLSEPSIYEESTNIFKLACGDMIRQLTVTGTSIEDNIPSTRRHPSTDNFTLYYKIGPLPMYGNETQVRIYPLRPYPYLGDEYITLNHEYNQNILRFPVIKEISDSLYSISRYSGGEIITEIYDNELTKIIIIPSIDEPIKPLIPGESCYSVNGTMVSASNLPPSGSFPLIGTAITELYVNLEIENNKQ